MKVLVIKIIIMNKIKYYYSYINIYTFLLKYFNIK